MKSTVLLIFVFLQICCHFPLAAQQSVILDSLNSSLETAETDSAKVMIYTAMAREYLYVDKSLAYRYIEDALFLAESENIIRERAYALRIMGAVLRENGFYLRGAQMITEAKEIFEKYEDQQGIANCFVSLAHVYRELDEFQTALELDSRAYTIFTDLQIDERRSISANNLARTLLYLGKYDSARMFVNISLEISRIQSNWPLVQGNYDILGQIEYATGKKEDAIQKFNKVLQIHRQQKELSNTLSTATAHLYLAKIYLELQPERDSVDYFIRRGSYLASRYGYLPVLKDLSEVGYDYYERENDIDNLKRFFKENQLVTDSLLILEKRNKKELLSWFDEQNDQRKELEEVRSQIEIQDFHILILLIISVAALLLVMLVFYFNRRQKYVNEMLKMQTDKLERLNEAKSKLFTIIAHDFKAPLNNLLGFSTYLSSHAEEVSTEDLKTLSGKISSSILKTNELLDNLLTWARSQFDGRRSILQETSISGLIEKTIAARKDEASKKNIAIIFEDSGDYRVNVDPDEVQTVLRNIISNAIKFTQEKGEIDIRVRKSEDELNVMIRDNGIGMDEETKSSLFGFETRSAAGTDGETSSSLGMALSLELIENNNGRIEVQSEKGKGSEFKIIFPLGS